jgi:hypothetical protein
MTTHGIPLASTATLQDRIRETFRNSDLRPHVFVAELEAAVLREVEEWMNERVQAPQVRPFACSSCEIWATARDGFHRMAQRCTREECPNK